MSADGTPWYKSIGDSGPLKKLASDPRAYIIGFVAAFLVENILMGVGAILAAIGAAFDQLARVPVIFGEGVGALGAAVFGAIAAMIGVVFEVAVLSAKAAGPFGPIIAVLWLFAVSVAVVAVVRWIIRLIGNYLGLT